MIFLTDSDAQRLNQQARMSDAAETNSTFFNQQLTLIIARIYEAKHKQIRYREYFRINNEGGAGITSIQMMVSDMVGSAKFIGHYADDLPSAQVGKSIITVGVGWIGASFHVTWMELQQASHAGISLSSERASAVDKALETKMNNIAFGIDQEATDAGMYGLLNQPNIPEAPVVDGATGSSEWATKTPNEILADINGAFTAVSESTFGAHMPDRMALPIEQYNLLVNTRLSDLSDITLMKFISDNLPWVNSADDIIPMFELKGAGESGEDIFVIWQDDEEIAELYIPYEKAPPVGTLADGLAYKTPVVMSTAGLNVRYPLAYYKGAGI